MSEVLCRAGAAKRTAISLAGAGLLALCLGAGFVAWNQSLIRKPVATIDPAAFPYEEPVPEFEVEATEFHKAIRRTVDYGPITKPRFVDAADSIMPDYCELIGVVVNGVPYGFLKIGMTNAARHIIQVELEEHPLAVTYCDLQNCVRVFDAASEGRPVELRVAGLDEDYGMVMKLNGVRYGQTSQLIPLDEYPFEITTLGEWKKRYPRSKVYPK